MDRLTPREELSKEKRQKLLAKFQYEHAFSRKEMAEYFRLQAEGLLGAVPTIDNMEVGVDIDEQKVLAILKALHNYLPEHRWKEK